MTTRKHDRCKHFGYGDCPQIDNKLMKAALLDISLVLSGSFQVMSKTPQPQEVDTLCCDCQRFSPA